MPAPLLTFDGVSAAQSGCGCFPPDSNGDVGPNHYVNAVNSAFRVFDKSGNPLSRMTVASLHDLGYVVDLNAAEPYSLPNLLVLAEAGLLAAPVASSARGIVLPNVPILLPETSLQ